MDIERIPEPITLTAAVAMFQESHRSRDLCALICEHCMKEQTTSEMEDAVNTLRDRFLEQVPPGYDSMTRSQASKLAKAVIGIGGIITIHDELESVVYDTIEAIVHGTRAALENFGNFVADNE